MAFSLSARFDRGQPNQLTAYHTLMGAHRHIILHEWEEDLRDLLEYNLMREGFEVWVIEDEAIVYQEALNLRPAMVVLGASTPLEVQRVLCSQLREDDRLAGMRLVCLTTSSECGIDPISSPSPLDMCIKVPATPMELMRKIREVLPVNASPASSSLDLPGAPCQC